MKPIFFCFLVLQIPFFAAAQPSSKTPNIFIITIDGFRWQELYEGADPHLVTNPDFVSDTSLTKEMYWDSTAELRRRKLMPFFWNVIAEKGQLYGNRTFHNKVNVKNFLKISYPGYNEILTGKTNFLISPNLAINNPNRNVLEYLNDIPEYHGKVVVFSSWNIFPYILNEQRNELPVNSGYQMQPDENNGDQDLRLIDSVQQGMSGKTNTRYDELTYLNAREYIKSHHPSVVFISFGETDEFAHAGRYDLYLQHAADIDRMIATLWYDAQTDPYYKGNTSFLITTDHGRGSKKISSWTTHGFWVKGSGETWLAMMGPHISPMGEIRSEEQIYQRQLASTIAILLGQQFNLSSHKINPVLFDPGMNNKLADNK